MTTATASGETPRPRGSGSGLVARDRAGRPGATTGPGRITRPDRAEGPGEGPTPLVAWAASAWIAALLGWAATPSVVGRGVVAGLAGLAGIGVVLLAAGIAGRDAASTGRRPGRSLVRTAAGVVLVAVVAATTAHARAVSLERSPLADLARRGGAAAMEATVASEPDVGADGRAWMLVTVTRVDEHHGRWRALVSGFRDPPPVGTRLAGVATARPLEHDGFGGFLRRRHAAVEVTAQRWHRIGVATGPLGLVDRFRVRVRTVARRGLDGDAAALATGLVTGDTRGLSPATEDGMRATGLTHLVAVSGSNVALVLAVVMAVTATLPRWLRRVAMVTALVAFTVTTRVEPSVLRAAVMASLVLLADLRGVATDAVHALAGTVLVLVLVDPAAAGSLGLVLSALATAGVLVVAPALARRLARGLPRPVASVLAATLGAQLAVAPVLLTTVGEVPLVSVPANLVAVPAAAVASVLATIGAVLAPFVPDLAAVVFSLARPALAVVLTVAAHLRGPVVSSATPLVGVAAVAASAVLLGWRRRPVRRTAVVVLVASLAWLGPFGDRLRVGPGADGQALAVTAIDVGQGDALLVTTASGHRILVDVGGDDTAATWLRRHGIARLDLLVLTHPHADHVGGLPDVLATAEVPTVWVGASADGAGVDLERVATAAGSRPSGLDASSRVVAVAAGDHAVLGSARLDVLAPPADADLAAADGGANDRSVVLRIAEGERVALLTGDVEEAGQRWLLARSDLLRASLLKVPHHGAATTDPDFLAAIAPRVALVSVGRDNDYGHPAPRLLAWLDDLDVAVHRTDQAGTVTLVVPEVAADPARPTSMGLPSARAPPVTRAARRLVVTARL